jgi:hypothetical protein
MMYRIESFDDQPNEDILISRESGFIDIQEYEDDRLVFGPVGAARFGLLFGFLVGAILALIG